MNGPRHFNAPWNWQLRLTTVLSSVLLCALPFMIFLVAAPPSWLRVLLGVMGPVGLLTAAFFAIRGYEIGDRELSVLRPGWRSRLKLEGLRSVEFDPEATRWSMRVCGNGGLFAFCGWFRNKRLKGYRLFGTDLKLSVVLFFDDRRVVVTPEEPRAFAAKLREVCHLD